MTVATPRGWTVLPLGQLAHIERGRFSVRPRNDPKYYGGKFPFIQTGDVRNSEGRIRSYSQTLNDDGLKVSKLFPAGTLFLTIAANIGDLGISEFASACPDSVVAVRPYSQVDKLWLYYVLSSQKANLESIASQNAQANLNIAKLAPFPILVPSRGDQAAIAQSLRGVDDLIEALAGMTAKTQAVSDGMAQGLLTGRTRLTGFTERWSEVMLGTHATGLRGAGLNKESLRASGAHSCILYGELFTTYGRRIDQVWSRTNADSGVRSQAGDVLVPGSTTTIARDLATASALHSSGVLLGGDTNIVRPGASLDPNWLAYYVTHRLGDRVAEIAQGTTIKHLYVRDLLNCRIVLPSVAEQRAIVGALLDVDTEVSMLQMRLRKTREIKRGMMQVLLTGRTRVPTSEVAA